MAMVAERVGRGPCPNCGESVTFKRSAGKLLNFKCDACCSSGYSEPGGTCHDRWARTVKPFAVGDGTRPDMGLQPVKDPPADHAPPPRKKSSAFSLGDLA